MAVLPPLHGVRRLFDATGRPFELVDGVLKVDELPAEGVLRADNGVRFDWKAQGRGGRRGTLGAAARADGGSTPTRLVDPRAAFCEDEVKAVWTQARRHADSTIKVHRVDRERYQLLLDRLPPTDTLLYLPLDLRNLQLQRRALRQLAEAPLPHHAPLLRLCEDPSKVRWPARGAAPADPLVLADRRDAAAAPTSSVGSSPRPSVRRTSRCLEGPPGSGKTTAICELIQQLVADGQRVLLCASTHAAIDNVIERLLANDSPIDAVRVGRLERVDETVQACQLDQKVDAMIDGWRDAAACSRRRATPSSAPWPSAPW